MNTINDNTPDLEELLRRAAGHLTTRGSEYLEHPVTREIPTVAPSRRARRVLIGFAAVAALAVVALAGSLIGGTSSGKVEIAEAAWSAVPSEPSAEQVRIAQRDCGITADMLARIENVPPASIPGYMVEPAIVDLRGTTTTAVYFTWSTATLCIQFGDGSMSIPQIPMASAGESAWQEPVALDLLADVSATMIVGFLPPNTSGSDPNGTSESEAVVENQWEAYVEAPGLERTKASVNGIMGRYVAWVPVTGDFSIVFVNVKTGEEMLTGVRTGTAMGLQPTPTSVWPAAEPDSSTD